MPRPVLAAIHATGTCRLHMYRFHLDSLVVHRTSHPQVIDIDPDDYTLATSPALYSVTVEVRYYETDGQLNYHEEAVLGMSAGAAPNLRHLELVPSRAGDSLDLREAVRLGKPPAPPDNLFTPKVRSGSLHSLFGLGSGTRNMEAWAAHADFSKLCRLSYWPWDPKWASILVDVAARGELAALKSLHVCEIGSDGPRTMGHLLTALNQNSLQSLSLAGHIDDALFQIMMDRHGESLRYLSFSPYAEDSDDNRYNGNPPAPPVDSTPDLFARLAEKCPSLEVAELQMDRTAGDARECAMYRGLSRLPRLKRLSLYLRFVVCPNEDEQAFDEIGNPMYYGEDLPRAFISQAFTNAAIDADLARAIFDRLTASPGKSSLGHLQLLVRRKKGRYAPAGDDARFDDLLRWFAREWICERRRSGEDDTPTVDVREREPHATAEGGKEWQVIGEGKRQFGGEDVFVQAFGDVWPQTTPRWWEDWKSMPLCPDD